MQFAKADVPVCSLIWKDYSLLKKKVMYNSPCMFQGQLPCGCQQKVFAELQNTV